MQTFKTGDKVKGSWYGSPFSGEIVRRIASYTEGVSRSYRADLEVLTNVIRLDGEVNQGGWMRNEITMDDSDARGERINMVLA